MVWVCTQVSVASLSHTRWVTYSQKSTLQCTCITFTFSVWDFTLSIVFGIIISDRTITGDWQEKKASVQFLVERKWLLLNVSVFIWCTIPQMQNKYFKSLYCIPTPWVVMPYRKVVGFFFFLFVLLFIGWGFFSLIASVTIELLGPV